jgi:hypothetical protein
MGLGGDQQVGGEGVQNASYGYDFRLEAGGWRLEAGGWRLEAGGWRLEAGELRGALSCGSAGYLFTGNGNFFGFAHDADGVF